MLSQICSLLEVVEEYLFIIINIYLFICIKSGKIKEVGIESKYVL